MQKAPFVRDAQLERLRANIGPNLGKYKEHATWVGDYFGSDPWFLQSSVEVPGVALQMPKSKVEHLDLENTRLLYGALRHLTPLQAADERLWVYMTHVTHWDYMRTRWALEEYEKKSPEEYVRDRYFFMSDRPRALIRNGLARLWWYGYTTYDDSRQDPFELTAVLLKNLDVTQTILERAFSRNRTVTRAMLSVLLQREQSGVPFYDRDSVRDLAKHMVHVGGVTVIDALSQNDLEAVVSKKVAELVATA